MQPLDIYVLGAGASYVHGAPLTDEIVPLALTELPDSKDSRLQPLRHFLKQAFHFDPSRRLTATSPGQDSHWCNCPGLVDLLSVVDMALDRRENLLQGFDQDGLRRVRQSIEFAIFKVLEWALSYRNPTRRRSDATKRLVRQLNPQESAIISFNYDVIIDIALSKHADAHFTFQRADVEMLSQSAVPNIDYGVTFANLPSGGENGARFKLLKLHGSFNWVASALTGNLYFGGLQKSVGAVMDYQRAMEKNQKLTARRVENLRMFFNRRAGASHSDAELASLEPILVTPTHLKDLRRYHLSHLWREAEEVLRRAKSITFIGYSLPGDDLHIKYLFKHALETRSLPKPPKITVVDYHKKTRNSPRSQVEANYRRFFGDIDFFSEGFDEFVKQQGW